MYIHSIFDPPPSCLRRSTLARRIRRGGESEEACDEALRVISEAEARNASAAETERRSPSLASAAEKN
jgi:GH24 family phage-related lysozyme (muramidase)